MSRRLLLSIALLAALRPAARAAAPEDSLYVRDIERVEITGTRPMKEIGVQRTKLDSIVLRDNISSSLADALTSGSTIFIKSYGRATLATASFRGTSPSHTQVTWNGMKVNSPLFGQVDFSLIPAYFIDNATLYHGASSVGITGGGLGGAITLATRPGDEEGFRMRYIQGIGSFTTFDEFLHLSYTGARWSASTRLLCSTSENDFLYRNYHTKEFETDADGNIVGTSYPLRRNRNGGFRDIHLLQRQPPLDCRLVPRFAPGPAAAQLGPQRREVEEGPAGRADAARHGRLGAARKRAEARPEGGLHLHRPAL